MFRYEKGITLIELGSLIFPVILKKDDLGVTKLVFVLNQVIKKGCDIVFLDGVLAEKFE